MTEKTMKEKIEKLIDDIEFWNTGPTVSKLVVLTKLKELIEDV
jgi:hypothetical protein